jgi:hypothetical protein
MFLLRVLRPYVDRKTTVDHTYMYITLFLATPNIYIRSVVYSLTLGINEREDKEKEQLFGENIYKYITSRFYSNNSCIALCSSGVLQ